MVRIDQRHHRVLHGLARPGAADHWGFALFVGSSICWITGALMTRDEPLWTQNMVPFGINCLGVCRYLIRKKKPHDAD
jgi:hypothetical protein